MGLSCMLCAVRGQAVSRLWVWEGVEGFYVVSCHPCFGACPRNSGRMLSGFALCILGLSRELSPGVVRGLSRGLCDIIPPMMMENEETGVESAEVVEEDTLADDSPAEPKVKHPPCPTCNEEWDGGASFCSYCGFQDTDESNPLHPPPVLVDGIADAAGVLGDEERAGIGRIIGEHADIPVFFVTFNTPEDQTPAGFAFSLYNDWTVGIANGERGILFYYDPAHMRVEIAIGRGLFGIVPAGAVSGAASELAEAISRGDTVEGFRRAVAGILR